jgi:hypothetical protein
LRFGFAIAVAHRCPEKPALDKIPAGSEIPIVLRQRPERVEMIGQNTDRNSLKRPARLNGTEGFPQTIYLFDQ